jgi:hypothetical protein
MKKLLFLSLISGTLIATTSHAQDSGPAVAKQQTATQQTPPQFTPEQIANMVKEAQEKQGPVMVEKTGLTTAQVNRIIEINFEIRVEASKALAGLSDADRTAKLAEFKTLKEKKYSEIPLSADQIKTVYAYYEDMGKNMPKRN